MTAAPQLIGRMVAGRFRITGFIGEGAMAAVYRGVQEAEPHDVAIKIMHPQLLGDVTFVGRFRREAKAAARLHHPNTVRIIDYGVDGRLPYIAMELVTGQDLFEILVLERRLSEARAARILMGICDALAVAHEQGIVHRDLKPENVMILRDPANPAVERVKVLDFGIAKIVDAGTPMEDGVPTSLSTSALTTVGVVVGTPAYMSPEQCRGDPVDGRSDVYACGILLYLLVTGRLPFQPTGAPWEVAMEHIRTTPPAPSTFLPQIHPGLEASILTALSKWPAQRQQTAGELREELSRLLPSLSDGVPTGPTVTIASADTMPVESLRSRPVASVRELVEGGDLASEAGGAGGVHAEVDRPPPPSFDADTARTMPFVVGQPGAGADPGGGPAPPGFPPKPLLRTSDPEATTDPVPTDLALSLEAPDSDRPPLSWEEPSAEVETRVIPPDDPSRSAPPPPPHPRSAPTTPVVPVWSPADRPGNAGGRPARSEGPGGAPSGRVEPARQAMVPAPGEATPIRRQPAPRRPTESMLVRLVVPAAVVIGLALGALAFFLMR
jgi:serine/threonine-protein kinase